METIKQYTIESCPPYIEWERISLLQNKNGVLFVKIEEKSFNGKHYIFPLDEIRGIYVIPCNTPYRGEGCVEIYTRMKTFIYIYISLWMSILKNAFVF